MEQTVTFTQFGLCPTKVIVTDDVTFEATAVVLVEDAVAFEAMLNAKWSGMIGRLPRVRSIKQSRTKIAENVMPCGMIGPS